MKKKWRIAVFLLLFFTLTLTFPSFRVNASAQTESVSITSSGIIGHNLNWLHTAGSLIEDNSGRAITLRGATRMEMSWWAPPNSLAGSLSVNQWITQMKNFGVSIIQVFLSSDTNSGWQNRWGNPDYKTLLDNIVKTCTNHGIYLILTWKTPFSDPNSFDDRAALNWMSNSSAVETWMKWWEEITTRYQNNSNAAIFDIASNL